MPPGVYLLIMIYPQPAEKSPRLMQAHNYRKGMKMPADPAFGAVAPIHLHRIFVLHPKYNGC